MFTGMPGYRTTECVVLCCYYPSGVLTYFLVNLEYLYNSIQLYVGTNPICSFQSAGFSAASDATRVSILLGILKVDISLLVC